jgi:hypothetical protein
VDRTQARQARAAVTDAGRRAHSPIELEREIAGQLARVLPFDNWCGMTTDPGTGQITGGFHEDGFPQDRLPRLLDIENGAEQDVFRLRDMRTDPRAARTLSEATGGDLALSARFRDVFSPSGIRHEVRLSCRDSTGTWGVLIFMRADDVRDFSPAEVALLGNLSGRIAEGLRRTTAAARAAGSAPTGPGLLLLTAGEKLVIDQMSNSARQWLSEIDDGAADGIPHTMTALARQAMGRSGTTPRCASGCSPEPGGGSPRTPSGSARRRSASSWNRRTRMKLPRCWPMPIDLPSASGR